MPNRPKTSSENLPNNENPVPKNENALFIYEKCIECPDLGIRCNGPNMLTLPIEGVREMVRRWKESRGLTNDQLAAICKVPRGTIDRFLSDADGGFNYTTVSMINNGIVRYGQPMNAALKNHPCPADSSEIRKIIDAQNQTHKECQEECQRLQKKIAENKGKQIEEMKSEREARERERQDQEKRVQFLKNLATIRLWIILVLAVALILLVFGFVQYLIMDAANGNFGHFQW